MKFSFFLTSRLNGIRRRERELEKGVDEGGWIEYWIRVVNFIGNQKIVHNLVGFWKFCGHELGLLGLRSAKD